MIVFGDRVKETTLTTGLGSYTLAGPLSSFQSFARIGDGNQCVYAITDGTNWETGIGTYSTTGPTLTRDTIYESSNGDAAVNWPVGPKQIYNTPLAEYAKQAYRMRYAGINQQFGTTYQLVEDDEGKIVECSNASPITVTIPTDVTFDFPVGARIDIIQTGAGQVTMSHAGTLNGPPKTPGFQWSAVTIFKRAANNWVVIGGVA